MRPYSTKTLAIVVICCLSIACMAQAASPGQNEPRGTSSTEKNPAKATKRAKDGNGTNAGGTKSTDGAATVRNLGRNMLKDQEYIWTSPLRLRSNDLLWALPLTAATVGAFAADRAVKRDLSQSPSFISRSSNLSNLGAAAFGGMGAGMYFWGLHTHNDHMRETGLLSGQAALNSLAISEVVKTVAGRQRPFEGNGRGDFFQGGTSFPSEHSAAAWSIATVVAHEYPGILTKLLAYGGAAAVGAARVAGQKHFTSDVLVGSALGWYVGYETYKLHAKESLESENIGTFVRTPKEKEAVDPEDLPSPYVPMDSWVYEAFDRLNALGYIEHDIDGLKPWTRYQCAKLVEEAGTALSNETIPDSNAESLYESLKAEFAGELRVMDGGSPAHAQLDSVYTRFMGIGGTPLTDSFHFGQTITNDFGRPYGEGFNQVTGMSGHAQAGPFLVYVRGEYQHSAGVPELSTSARTAIANADGLPVAPGIPSHSLDRFRLLDAYVALNVDSWQFSFGKQSLWWGPGESSDLMMSDNAEPVYMLRLTRVAPFKLPGLASYLGPIQTDTFLGQLQGYHFLRLGQGFQLTGSYNRAINPQPFIWGEKFNFKPTPNLEFGFSITTVFAGLGRPMTFGTFFHTFSSSGNAQALEPGDRRTGFDFRYKVPGLRNWLVFYSGSLAEDQPNPIAYPRRSAWNPGIYLPKIPKFNKLDLRVESAYTDLPSTPQDAIVYRNAHYADGYRNYGQIMGSWIGPEARGIQAKSTYWFSGVKKIQLGYRRQLVNRAWTGGGNLSDFSAGYDFPIKDSVQVSTMMQYERWNFPVLSSQPTSNFAVSLQFTYKPRASK